MKCTQSILEESAGYRIFLNLFYVTKLFKEEERNMFFCYGVQEVSKTFHIQRKYDPSVPSWGDTGDVDLYFKNNNVYQRETHSFKSV